MSSIIQQKSKWNASMEHMYLQKKKKSELRREWIKQQRHGGMQATDTQWIVDIFYNRMMVSCAQSAPTTPGEVQ